MTRVMCVCVMLGGPEMLACSCIALLFAVSLASCAIASVLQRSIRAFIIVLFHDRDMPHLLSVFPSSVLKPTFERHQTELSERTSFRSSQTRSQDLSLVRRASDLQTERMLRFRMD